VKSKRPKLKNLKIAGTIVCIFAVFSTGVITLLGRHDHSGCPTPGLYR
jgi:hypothetical protein